MLKSSLMKEGYLVGELNLPQKIDLSVISSKLVLSGVDGCKLEAAMGPILRDFWRGHLDKINPSSLAVFKEGPSLNQSILGGMHSLNLNGQLSNFSVWQIDPGEKNSFPFLRQFAAQISRAFVWSASYSSITGIEGDVYGMFVTNLSESSGNLIPRVKVSSYIQLPEKISDTLFGKYRARWLDRKQVFDGRF